MKDQQKKEVTNLIEPVLVLKPHIREIGQNKLSDMTPLLGLVAATYQLNLSRTIDFKIAVKIIEESVFKN